MLHPAVLLFSLNLLDAFLTILWIRKGVATEANILMAFLLEISDLLFLFAKVSIGFIAMTVLRKWEKIRITRYGLKIAIAVYGFVILIHLFVGIISIKS